MKLTLRPLILFILFALSIQLGQAQQFNFSQYNFTDQRVNPALVGIGNYWKLGGIHREQNTGPDFDIKSTAIAGSYPFVKANDAGVFGGLGITLLDDKAGVGQSFKIQEVGLSYAMQVRLGANQQLALGVSGFYQTRKFGLDDLITNSQFIPGRGFDTSLDNGETSGQLQRSFYRTGVGLHWEKRDENDFRKSHFGLSAFDLNRANEAFVDSTFRTDPSYMVSAGLELLKIGSFSVYPEVLYTHTGGKNSVNAGVNARYDLADNSYFMFQGQYLTGGEFVAGVQFSKDDFRVGLSYDVAIDAVNTGNQGAFEIGFEFRGLVKSKSKPEKKRRKKPAKKTTTQVPPVKEEVIKKEEVPEPEPKEKETIEVVPAETDTVQIKTDTGVEGLEFEPFEVERITKHFGFDFNKAEITPDIRTYLDELVQKLNDGSYIKVEIEGHTDNIGSAEVNKRLSTARANAVRGYLISKGISAAQLKASGKGELEPISSNSTAKGRALNRRVEMIIYR